MTVFVTTDRDVVPVYQEELFMSPGIYCMGDKQFPLLGGSSVN